MITVIQRKNRFNRSSRSEVFSEKYALKICSKLAGKHTCQNVISIKLQSNFIEITLRHGCPPVNLLHIFRTPFTKSTSGWQPLSIILETFNCISNVQIVSLS